MVGSYYKGTDDRVNSLKDILTKDYVRAGGLTFIHGGFINIRINFTVQ